MIEYSFKRKVLQRERIGYLENELYIQVSNKWEKK